MRQLFWAAGIMFAITVFFVTAEAADRAPAESSADRLISPTQPLLEPGSPAEDEDLPGPGALSGLPAKYEGSSIEVGFSKNGDPEPHYLVVGAAGKATVYELSSRTPAQDLEVATEATVAPAKDGKKMPLGIYLRRIRQVVEGQEFFDAAAAPRKRSCKDKYILRVKVGEKFLERRGCAHQRDDLFALFSHNFYWDVHFAYSQK